MPHCRDRIGGGAEDICGGPESTRSAAVVGSTVDNNVGKAIAIGTSPRARAGRVATNQQTHAYDANKGSGDGEYLYGRARP